MDEEEEGGGGGCSRSCPALYCRWQPGPAASPGSRLEIQFATARTVNFFANFINAAEMFGRADAIMSCERGLGRAAAYGGRRLINYRFIFKLGLIKHYSSLISASGMLPT